MKKKFVSLGHIVNDTKPSDHLGGGVSYSAIAAARLGYESHIITKCPPHHPYIFQLEALGVIVHVLPSQRSTITTFSNIYDENGKRRQQVIEQQETISLSDISHMPKDILQDATILVAVVLSEVETSLYPFLSQCGNLHIAPQGYFRQLDEYGNVYQEPWKGFEKDITHATSIIFSEEDVTIEGEIDTVLLEKFKNFVPVTVMTQGEKGSTIWENTQTIHVTSLPLQKNEIVDFTGAGDTYAACFVTTSVLHSDIKQIAGTASFYASLKVMGFGGYGIDSIPTKEQVSLFITRRTNRYRDFLKKNALETLTLFEHQNP